MARYKHTEAEFGQGMFLSVNLKEQLLPGSFEYMLNELIGKKIDISIFDKNYKNDKTGSTAIPPRVLIKLIIYGYYKGIRSSRNLEELSRNNIAAKALAEDMEPHWTTISNFISDNEECFCETFIKTLIYCNELGLIGGKTFAGDGCRLSSNASLDMTGTKEELEKRLKLYRRMAENHIAKHKRQDERGLVDKEVKRLYKKQQKKLNNQIEKISGFIETMEKKIGMMGRESKSNITDNESAMIHTSDGYIQGYIGMAVSDKKEQIIVGAQAVGSANEGEHYPQMLNKTLSNLNKAGVKRNKKTKVKMLLDKNYFREENIKASKENNVEVIMPDPRYRQRLRNRKAKQFESEDFKYCKRGDYYKCPNGKKLTYRFTTTRDGQEIKEYMASVKNCRVCPVNKNCLRTKKELSKIKIGRKLVMTAGNSPGGLLYELRKKLNTIEYQDIYAERIQIIEPAFADITNCKKLDYFSLRGIRKVNGQWHLYCMVHNLGKCLKKYNKKKGYELRYG